MLVCRDLLILCLLFQLVFFCYICLLQAERAPHSFHFWFVCFGLSLSVCFVSGCVSVFGLAGFKGLNVNHNRAESILLWCLSLSMLFL